MNNISILSIINKEILTLSTESVKIMKGESKPPELTGLVGETYIKTYDKLSKEQLITILYLHKNCITNILSNLSIA